MPSSEEGGFTRVGIDAVRAYWDERPCNIRHSRAPIGSRTYFDEVEQRKYFVEPHIPAFADFPRWEGARVLEIGCGIGTDAVNFARHGADYVGIDLSRASVELARQRLRVYNLTGRIEVANVEELDALELGPEQFDLIYSFGVLHHTPHPDRALAQLRQVCRASGELRIMLYARNSWKAAMISGGLDQPEAQSGCPIALTFTHEQAIALVEGQGFAVESISQDHIFPYQVSHYINHEYVREPWFAAMPESMFRVLELEMGWHLLIRARAV